MLELTPCHFKQMCDTCICCLPSQVSVERNYAVFMKHPNNFQRKIGTLKSSQIETKVTNYDNQGMLLVSNLLVLSTH